LKNTDCSAEILNFTPAAQSNQKKFELMKITFKIVAACLLLFAGVTTVSAQRWEGGPPPFDPEKRAQKQTQLMVDSLSLSAKQGEKVKEINLKYAEKMKELRNNAEVDRDAIWEKMNALRQEQDKELQTLVTAEQWDKWLKVRESERKKFNGPRNGKGRQGPPPPPPHDDGN
jgi:Spy/CpxP family protein refolding chaperone